MDKCKSEILKILALKRIVCESVVLFYFSLRIFLIRKALHAYKNSNNIKVYKVIYYKPAYFS